VGLVKRLVDHASAATVHMCEPDRITEPLAIEWMRVENGLAILKKPGRLPALSLGGRQSRPRQRWSMRG
jgi:hypothetical protein